MSSLEAILSTRLSALVAEREAVLYRVDSGGTLEFGVGRGYRDDSLVV